MTAIERRSGAAPEEHMATTIDDTPRVVFWHRQLPPLSAEPVGEHTVEAVSRRVPFTFARDDEEWARCYADLMAQAQVRLEQEIARLGGHYAHVRHEVISARHDHVTGEVWLYGRFDYLLYLEPRPLP